MVDPVRALELLAETHGVHWSLAGHVQGGGEGTRLADTGSGFVAFKVSEHAGAHEEHSARVVLLEHLRGLGYPMPQHHAPFLLPGGWVLRPQEWLADCQPPPRLTHRLVDQLCEASELQAGAAATGTGWSDFVRRTLTEGADGWCLHQPLRDAGGRAARLLERVAAVQHQTFLVEFPSTDAMHIDLHAGNILQRDGSLVAVIDWGGARAGDRSFDLVTLAFGSRQVDPGVTERLWDLIEIEDGRRAAYLAHLAVRYVDWSLRKTPDTVEYWLDQSEATLKRFA